MRDAVLSECGRYRYTLTREWLGGEGTCCFVMLNPSTADANEDDPTIKRCVDFAQRWGFQRLTVGNLFAFRATDPAELALAEDPVGPDNDDWLSTLLNEADEYVAAWGARKFAAARAKEVHHMMDHGFTPLALRVTTGGQPGHPLYVPADIEPVRYGYDLVYNPEVFDDA